MGKEEREALLNWLKQEGLSRPERFEERIHHAEYMRQKGNDWYQKGDYRRALHCCLGAVHCLDYPPLWQQGELSCCHFALKSQLKVSGDLFRFDLGVCANNIRQQGDS